MFEEYKKRYEDAPDELDKPSKELAEAWLDAQIEMHREIQRAYDRYDVPLCYGHYGDKGYEHEIIESCNVDYISFCKPRLLIWKGIDLLADILGLPLEVGDQLSDSAWRYEYFIEYKGVIIYQLEDEKLEGCL